MVKLIYPEPTKKTTPFLEARVDRDASGFRIALFRLVSARSSRYLPCGTGRNPVAYYLFKTLVDELERLAADRAEETARIVQIFFGAAYTVDHAALGTGTGGKLVRGHGVEAEGLGGGR
jgi:hypothetical protein